MDVSTTAATSALRVGVQVLSSLKRPAIEVYNQMRNVIMPEESYVGKDAQDHPTNIRTIRHHAISVTFTAVNIGGARAENVTMRIVGKFRRNAPREDFGERFRQTIPHMAPGQVMFLFEIGLHDFNRYPADGGSPIGMKDEELGIDVEYDGPREGLNRIGRWWANVRKRRQYVFRYRFNPLTVRGDLPPAEYA
jgi:hypothetical protein